MTLLDIDEDHPIWKAIDSGGGQTCDVKGVLKKLYEAGYDIIEKPLNDLVWALPSN